MLHELVKEMTQNGVVILSECDILCEFPPHFLSNRIFL